MGRVTHHIQQHNCSKGCNSPTDCTHCHYTKRAATIVTCKEVGLDFDFVFPDLPTDPENIQDFNEESDTKENSMNESVKLGVVGNRGSRKLRWLDQQEQEQQQEEQQCSSNHQDSHLITVSDCANISNNCSESGSNVNSTTPANPSASCMKAISQEGPGSISNQGLCANKAGYDQVSGEVVVIPETGINKGVAGGTLEVDQEEGEDTVGTVPGGLPAGEGVQEHHKGGYIQLQNSDLHTLQDQDTNTSSTMTNSDVPLVVLTTCVSEDTTDTAIDDDIDDLRDIRDVNDVIFASARGLLGNSDLVVSTDTSSSPLNPDHQEPPLSAPPTTTTAITSGRQKHHRDIRRSASVRSEGPPSYHSIFSSDSKTRLSLPSARDAFRRLSDVWRQGSPRSSMTSVYPESPTSVTTLTGFIIRDKNAEGETHTRQVFRLAAVLLVCGIAISILETVTSLHREAMVTGYPYAGIGAGIFIASTGVLGILAVTRKDCPHKYFSFYKGLSLISLLMGVVVLCGTLANLDVRWLSQASQAANLAEIVLYITKVLLAGVDIAAALASIYI